MARLVLEQTGLLPHLNPGVMEAADLQRLRPVSASMGLMLESASNRLCERGGPHFGSPDKLPARRLATLRAAGELRIPMTTGLLIGIGETRRERIESLLALRALHETLRSSAGTHHPEFPGQARIRGWPQPPSRRWRSSCGPSPSRGCCSVRACRSRRRPTCSPTQLDRLVRAGINDWGGVSPVTPDHVNPEAPWPHWRILRASTAAAGRDLVERLALGPALCGAARRLDGSGHHAARAALERQSRICATGRAGLRVRGLRIAPRVAAPLRCGASLQDPDAHRSSSRGQNCTKRTSCACSVSRAAISMR